MKKTKPAEYGEELILRVAWSCTPNHTIRQGEVMADAGIHAPTPPITRDEMEHVMFAAKMELLRRLRLRKRTKPLAE